MIDLRVTNGQLSLFSRYSQYITKIREYEKRNEPLNQRKLSKLLGITKGRVGVVLKILEENQLIKREFKPEHQQRGGKSKFLFLTPIGEKLYVKLHDAIKEKIEPKSIKSDIDKIKENMNEFKDNHNTIKLLNLRRINEILSHHMYSIEWKDLPIFEKFIIDNFKDVILNKKYEIKTTYFLILKGMIENDFKNNLLFSTIYTHLIKNDYEFKNIDTILQPVLNIIVYDLIHYPNNCNESKSLFLNLFFKYGEIQPYYQALHEVLGQISILEQEIKLELIEEIKNHVIEFEDLSSLKEFCFTELIKVLE